MPRRVRLSFVLAAVLAGAAIVSPAVAQEDTPNLVGTWEVSIGTTSGGDNVQTWRITKQEGGTFSGDGDGNGQKWSLTGTIAGNVVTASTPYTTTRYTANFTGTLGTDGRMTGTFTDTVGTTGGIWGAGRKVPKLIVDGQLNALRRYPGRIPVAASSRTPRTFHRIDSERSGAYRIEVPIVAGRYTVGVTRKGWCVVGVRACADAVTIDTTGATADVHKTVNFETSARHARTWGYKSVLNPPGVVALP